jgi:hypothetical protein
MPDSAPEAAKLVPVGADPTPAAGGVSGGTTLFNFSHKVFALPNARFRLAEDGREPIFRVQLGDLDVGIPIATLAHEFGIDPTSRDAQLIGLVRKALRFVAEIRRMDSVPSEIVDGRASWPVEERHRACAKAKLMKQLAQWFASECGDAAELERMLRNSVEDEAFRAKVQQVFTKIAEKLGLGAEHRQQVVDQIDSLGRELSYIEAQREQVVKLSGIKRKVLDLARVYTKERTMVEELLRIAGLIQTPIAEFADTFQQLDAQTGEIIALLRNIEAQLDFIRTTRDELHFRLLSWGDLVNVWHNMPVITGRETETKTRSLYHFLASHYSPKNVWR